RGRARHRALRARADQARSLAHARRHDRRADRRPGKPRAGGGPAAAAELRPGARLLAPVLPEPARLAGDRRDRADRRLGAPTRARRGASDAGRRQRPTGRSACPRQGREEGQGSRADRLAGDRNRTRDRGLTVKAVNLLPRDARRRGGPAIPPALAATAIGGFTVMMAALALLFVSAHGTVKSRRLELEQKK